MKKKLMLLMFSILLFTGCSADYELDISDEKVDEDVTISVPDSLEISKKDRFLTELKVDQLAIYGGYDSPYYKTNNNGNDYNFKYTFDKEHSIKDSRILTSCFEHYKIEQTDSYYMFVFKGKFKCSYDFDNIDIKVKTDNEVSKHNSTDYDKYKGEYNWRLNKSNYDDSDIKFIVLKNSYPDKIKDTSTSIFKNIALTLLLAGIVVLGYKFIKNILKVVDNFQK